jgi:uncharacterized protein YlxW (UPF0749 family)
LNADNRPLVAGGYIKKATRRSEAKNMKIRLSFILFIAFAAVSTLGIVTQVAAQESKNSAQAAEDLRTQLLDVQAKESRLQARARQLDEDLKPENIERSLAGIGSTKPEELRELRRRELNIERERVQAQLKLLATSRERLESTIRFAESQAYQESADGTTTATLQVLKGQFATRPRAVAAMLLGFTAILGIVLVVALIRRSTTT